MSQSLFYLTGLQDLHKEFLRFARETATDSGARERFKTLVLDTGELVWKGIRAGDFLTFFKSAVRDAEDLWTAIQKGERPDLDCLVYDTKFVRPAVHSKASAEPAVEKVYRFDELAYRSAAYSFLWCFHVVPHLYRIHSSRFSTVPAVVEDIASFSPLTKKPRWPKVILEYLNSERRTPSHARPGLAILQEHARGHAEAIKVLCDVAQTHLDAAAGGQEPDGFIQQEEGLKLYIDKMHPKRMNKNTARSQIRREREKGRIESEVRGRSVFVRTRDIEALVWRKTQEDLDEEEREE